jgi:hypothetical protein
MGSSMPMLVTFYETGITVVHLLAFGTHPVGPTLFGLASTADLAAFKLAQSQKLFRLPSGHISDFVFILLLLLYSSPLPLYDQDRR